MGQADPLCLSVPGPALVAPVSNSSWLQNAAARGASQERGIRSSLEDAHGELGASGSASGSADLPVVV